MAQTTRPIDDGGRDASAFLGEARPQVCHAEWRRERLSAVSKTAIGGKDPAGRLNPASGVAGMVGGRGMRRAVFSVPERPPPAGRFESRPVLSGFAEHLLHREADSGIALLPHDARPAPRPVTVPAPFQRTFQSIRLSGCGAPIRGGRRRGPGGRGSAAVSFVGKRRAGTGPRTTPRAGAGRKAPNATHRAFSRAGQNVLRGWRVRFVKAAPL